ncbi:DNA repair protein XRCC2-like [Tubulanus polymorphus]|uniref:DNA repair protein XRCC2-like n=1 Tax=Tubulanus polymorphus TaxID=672921 RepID=UPI003DA1DD2D
MESGIQFFSRLGTRSTLKGLHVDLFGESGPEAGCVYELTGDAGTAKTLTLLHLITRAILPEQWNGVPLYGLGVELVFIDTDYQFSILKLATLIETFVNERVSSSGDGRKFSEEETENFVKNALKNIHILRCANSSQLLITLLSIESFISSRPEIAGIFVDSIGAFYWLDRSNGGDCRAVQEANTRRIVNILRRLVESYNLTVLATKTLIFQNRATKETSNRQQTGVERHQTGVEWDYMCDAWTRFVTDRIRFEHSSEDQSFCCVSKTCGRKFTICETGIRFIQS